MSDEFSKKMLEWEEKKKRGTTASGKGRSLSLDVAPLPAKVGHCHLMQMEKIFDLCVTYKIHTTYTNDADQ